MEENYNTLIKQAVRAVLKPKGMFQKGSTRIWIDDNGWFFTVVEFQGSCCDRGSYLNIGMQHLWNEWEYLFTVCGTREAREGTFLCALNLSQKSVGLGACPNRWGRRNVDTNSVPFG